MRPNLPGPGPTIAKANAAPRLAPAGAVANRAAGSPFPWRAAALLLATSCGPQADRPVPEPPATPLVVVDRPDSLLPEWSVVPLFATPDTLPLLPGAQAVFLPDSSIWVSGSSELYAYAKDGHFLRTIGRRGAGPGEFQLISTLVPAADGSVLVGDFATGRQTRLGPDGTVVATVPRLESATGELEAITLLTDGRILATRWQQRPNKPPPADAAAGHVSRDSAPLLVFDSVGHPERVLATWAGRERGRVSLGGDPAWLPVELARTVIHDGRDGITAIGSSDSLDLTVWRADRPVVRLVGPAPSRPDQSLREAWRQAIREEAPDVAPQYLDAISQAKHRAARPAVGGVVVSGDGSFWVGDFAVGARAPRRWRQFSADGRALGSVMLSSLNPFLLPGTHELLDAQGDLLAVRRIAPVGEVRVEVLRVVRR